MLVLFTWRVLLISPDITVVHTHPVGDEPGTAILFDATIVAAITRSSVENLNLQPGDTVRVIGKATEVMIAK